MKSKTLLTLSKGLIFRGLLRNVQSVWIEYFVGLIRCYLLTGIILTIVSCSNEDFEVPNAKVLPVPQGSTIPLENLRRPVANQFPQEIITYDIPDQFVDGYVISNDVSGNFFKELFIQDKPSQPTTGIQVLIDERALHQRFPFGVKIRIRLEGLSISEQNGIVKLGVLVDNQIEPIPFTTIDTTIFRTDEVAEIIPLDINIDDITEALESVYVSLSDIQLDKSVIVPQLKTFAGERDDSFDGLRPLFQCSSQAFLTLCTSTFAAFNQLSLPAGKGKITGVLTKDFRGFDYVLKLNEVKDIKMDIEERCDPLTFGCDTSIITSKEREVLFIEDFNTVTNPNSLEAEDWFNINVTGDEVKWDDKKITNIDNRVLDISANNTGLVPLEAWLITPEITVNTVDDIFFSCSIRTDNNNGKALNIWVTNGWDGNPLTTDWQLLDLEIPINNENYVTLLQKINCLEGNIRIGFQYRGFDPVITSIYEIDDVQFFKLSKE